MSRAARFRRWRRTRPFGGGLAILGGAVVVLVVPFATVRIGELTVSLATPGGTVAGVLVAAVLVCCTGAAWWRPRALRTTAGVVAAIAAVVAVLVANLGGLVVGSLLAVLGAAATLAWTPGPRPLRTRARSR